MKDKKLSVYFIEKIFLEVLIEGKATLYYYKQYDLKRFFYSINDTVIHQLVFKSYITKDELLKMNNDFRQQLKNDLQCPTISINDIKSLEYNYNDLSRFFLKYNLCTDTAFVNYKEKKNKALINISFRPGINISNLSIENEKFQLLSNNFGTKTNFRMGIEFEAIFGSKRKWGFIVEPTYQYYKAHRKSEKPDIRVNYNSIEFPIGARYYIFLSEKSKIFFDGLVFYDIYLNSSIDIDYSYENDAQIMSQSNLGLGLGYYYNNKLNVNVRYYGRSIINDLYWSSSYKTLSIIFGYKLF